MSLYLKESSLVINGDSYAPEQAENHHLHRISIEGVNVNDIREWRLPNPNLLRLKSQDSRISDGDGAPAPSNRTKQSEWICGLQPSVHYHPQRFTSPFCSNQTTSLPALRAPSNYLPRLSRRLSTTTIYITLATLALLLPTTTASPLAISRSHIHLQNRQAIPDKTGNTGNVPAPVKPLPPPLPLTPSSPPTVTITPSSIPTPQPQPPPLPTSTTSPSGNGNSNNNGGSSISPADELKLNRTSPILSTATLAGIIAGACILFLLLIGLAIVLVRRIRRPEIAEIPLRRSKLGSILRHRMFNSPLPPSLSRSRSSSSEHTLTDTGEERKVEERKVEERKVEERKDGLRKESIGRPMPTKWGEGILLSVPQAAFMKGEREQLEEGERWVGVAKKTISEPRPVRPASAEPLGRLSGMGLGMGYLK